MSKRGKPSRPVAEARHVRFSRKGALTFWLYTDDIGEWRWQMVARNGQILADSGEGYRDGGDAAKAIYRIATALADNNYSVRVRRTASDKRT